MKPDRTEQLTLWLAAQVEAQPGQVVELVHIGENGHTRAGSWPLKEGPLSELDAGELASLLVQTACNYVDAFTTPQTLQVLIQPSRKGWPMRIEPDPRAAMISPTEDATAKGLTAQSQRHTEAMARLMVQMASASTGRLAEQLEQSTTLVKRLMDERMSSLTVIEEAHGRRHERELALLKEQRTQDRIDTGIRTLTGMLPAVGVTVAKHFGADVQSLAPAAELQLLERMAETLEPEQLEAMARILTGEQQLYFGEVLKRIIERRAAASGAHRVQ